MGASAAIQRFVQRDPRLSRVLKGALSGLAGRGLALVVSAVTLPMTVRYLGPLQYGVWVTISTTVIMLSVLDLGIANSLTNYISRAFAQDSEHMARQYYATAFWATSGIATLSGLLIALGWRWIHWGALFHLTDPVLARQAGQCAAISLTFFLASLPLGLANKVLGGYQRIPVANGFSMLNSVLGMIAIVTTILLHGSIVVLMASFCVAMLMGTLLLNLWVALRHRPRIHALPRYFHRAAARDILGEGILFFFLQVAGLIVFSSDNVIIAHYRGASEVTPYSVAWRLTTYATMLQSLLVPALWPAFSEAYVRKDMTWIRTTYRRIMRGTVFSVGVAALILGVIGRPIIRLWAGPAAVPGAGLLWTMCFWAVLVSITVNQAALMAATQRLKLQAFSSTLAAALNLWLSIVLVQRMGAMGVLLATIVSYLLLILAPQAFEVRRILSGRYLAPAESPDVVLAHAD